MFSQSQAKPVNPYSGFVGLNTEHPDFASHVIKPDEIMNYFKKDQHYNQRYTAPYVYPYLPSDGFDKRVIFSAECLFSDTLTLRAAVVSNRHPATFGGWLAGKILPSAYTMKDFIQFKTNANNGFGEGSFTITTIACEYPNGKPAAFAKSMLGVANRPGLFLKIAKQDGGFHEDAMIFFPDKSTGLSHSSVKNGEAFVMVKEGVEITPELNQDIIASFNKLVKRSYGEHQGLYFIDTHLPLQAGDEVPKSCLPCK